MLFPVKLKDLSLYGYSAKTIKIEVDYAFIFTLPSQQLSLVMLKLIYEKSSLGFAFLKSLLLLLQS